MTKIVKIVLAVAAIGIAAICLSVVKLEQVKSSSSAHWINPLSKQSAAYGEAEKLHQWMRGNAKLTHATRSLKPADKLGFAGQLATNGLARLSTDLLEQRLPLVERVLGSLNTRLCARFIRGEIPDPELVDYAIPVMEAFSEAEAKAWFAVTKAAIEAELDGSAIIVLSTENAKQAIYQIRQSMYEPQAEAFGLGLASLQTEGDKEACATAQTLYSKGNSLPEPYRGYMARLLLTGKDGHQKP
ncbi:hypothetical protein PQR66_32655 [Paraburkholderia agricolaris]|uniref:Uncharacterized protein n=1 Tax=Paraburkholderia agricolaris TaxID=2152888 RepID=A0ABW8ZY91_9BURK